MILTKKLPLTEIEEFALKFPVKSKWKYSIESSIDGKIIQVKTEHKEIITHCKKIGLK